MEWSLVFFLNSLLLGVGLAMDAFSVSLANGLSQPDMGTNQVCGIAGVFAIFQAAMPLAGWVCVHTVLLYFRVFEKFIPWIALILLLYIGGEMLLEGLKNGNKETMTGYLSFSALMLQGVATSIDALSVGFTIADYGFLQALVCSLLIALVTFFLCVAGLFLGKRFGTRLSNRANILGGVILIAIGIEIFVTGVF